MAFLRGLVVDDSAQVRKMLTSALGRQGIRTLEAGSGVEALELARTSEIDFVVTDLEMPGMDGIELCRQLRRLTVTSTVPIVVVTGAHTQAEEATAAGCDVVLPKPCSPALLLATIQRLLVKSARSTDTQ